MNAANLNENPELILITGVGDEVTIDDQVFVLFNGPPGLVYLITKATHDLNISWEHEYPYIHLRCKESHKALMKRSDFKAMIETQAYIIA